MKKTVTYLLAGVLTLLGFSSCANLRQARQERLERERQAEADRLAYEQWQRDSAELARQEYLLDEGILLRFGGLTLALKPRLARVTQGRAGREAQEGQETAQEVVDRSFHTSKVKQFFSNGKT